MLDTLLYKLNSFPSTAWDFLLSGSLGAYDGVKDHDITSFVFYWRELWHLAGGLLVSFLALPLFLLPIPRLLAAILPILGVAIVIGYKEFLIEAYEQANGWDFKNVVDTVVWTSGAAVVSLGAYVFDK